ncbi:hypothetical protein [Nocardioides luteus]|uniref:hypothetical protein n=1 Tax=Nocardioides luteus TaxID=1844 RepID=UPI0018C9366A|nr:hypothetical protein [Nocardioides luteus]MBG6097162.1 hypothetical protein [Nocardioides luteus]
MTAVDVRAVIGGQDVSRAEILVWEADRLPKAASRIGLAVPPGGLREQRLRFAEAKLALGHDEIRRRLSRSLRVSDLSGRATARASRGGRVTSTCDLYVTGGDAAAFVAWFMSTERLDYELSMLAANPDHFLITTTPRGQQEVIETTGGSPLPSRFLIDYQDLTSLQTPLDPTYGADASGVARTESGLAIGGVRHQFRNTDSGFHAHLIVEFPRLLPSRLVRQHQWHLAAEFSNWIESAFPGSADS